MKKTIGLLLALTLMIGSVFGAGTVSANDSNTSSKTPSKAPFKYVITPDSPEWKNFSSLELKKKLNIPEADADSMDTETLLNAVLDYPYLGDIYAFNDPIKAIDFLAEQFDGLKVLLEREDLKDKLVGSYEISSDKIMKLKENEKIDAKERLKHKYRESLIAYPKVFYKLSKAEKDAIISNSKKVAEKINTNPITEEQVSTFGVVATSVNPGTDIGYGTVYTPRFSAVSVTRKQDFTATDKTYLDNYMDSMYPNATRLTSATYNFNCHSYAWYSQSVTTNTWWMNYPTKYMTDYSYYKCSTPASGMKIYYPVTNNEHSGIVGSVSGPTVYVKSKWGAYGVYLHAERDCPYGSYVYQNSYWNR